jgi:hypothetical protein
MSELTDVSASAATRSSDRALQPSKTTTNSKSTLTPTLQKSEVIITLHAMVHEGLFGSRPWLADREIVEAINNKLRVLGLTEPVPERSDSERKTAFGRELDVGLMQVFMGVWEPYEVPFILEDYGLLSDDEALEAEGRLEGEDPEAVLLPFVRHAFFQHFQAGARLN